ncbi:MAG: MipA/OmpV family protein, partial [Planctomycetota bacterium]
AAAAPVRPAQTSQSTSEAKEGGPGALPLGGASVEPPVSPAASREDFDDMIIIGPGAVPEFEGADDLQAIPFTVFSLRDGGRSVELEGPGGRIDVIDQGGVLGFDAGPAFNVRFPREDVGNAAIDSLEEVDFAFELGAFARYVASPGWATNDSLSTRLTVTSDVSGTHDGTVAALESEYSWFPRRNIRLSVGPRVTWASDGFTQAYFGVTPSGAAASGLAAYDPGSGLRSLGAQATASFYFSPAHGVFALMRYDRLSSDLADSPIVEEIGSADQMLVGIGYTYRF